MGSPNRFMFNKDRLSFPGETPGEAVYVGSKDGLIEEMANFPQETAHIFRHGSKKHPDEGVLRIITVSRKSVACFRVPRSRKRPFLSPVGNRTFGRQA